MDSRFCATCGFKLYERDQSPDAGRQVQPIDLPDLEPPPTLADLQNRFRDRFDERVTELGGKLKAYRKRAIESDFLETVENRFEQLIREVSKLEVPRRTRFLEQTFSDLLDYFLIEKCADLNPVQPPTAALTYQDIPAQRDNLLRIIRGYLELDKEKEQHFVDFLTMPQSKLQNASKAFLHASPSETLLLLFDNSLTGSLREGFGFTDRGLYWKQYFQPARSVAFTELVRLQLEGRPLQINGLFFDANRNVNLRMIYLLRKLRADFG